MDWRALIHDRRVQIGAAGAAAVGGYVLLRRKQTTGSTLSQPSDTSAGGGTAYTFPNTSGTDLASWLGSQEGVLAAQNKDFLDQLANSLGTAGIQPTAPTGTETPPAAPATPVGAGQAVSRTTITPGESLAPVLAFFGMTQQQFESLNPGIQSTYYNKPGSGAIGFSLPADRIVYVAGGKGF